MLPAPRGGGLVVIDTAPHASDAALAAARAADLVLIPCRASVADLHAIGSSLDVCQVADVPAYVVLNAVPVHGGLADPARAAMAEHSAAVAPAMLCQPTAHVHAFTAGLSVRSTSRCSPKQPPSLPPCTAGPWEETNERSIVRPPPFSRRPPSTRSRHRRARVWCSGWSWRCTSGGCCSPYRETPPCRSSAWKR